MDAVAPDLDRATFVDLAGEAGDRPVVVRTEFALDADTTPLSAYAALTGRTANPDAEPADSGSGAPSGGSHTGSDGKLAAAEYAFLLESAEKTASSDPDGAFRPGGGDPERHARYSYVGYDPAAVVTVADGERTVESLSAAVPAGLLVGSSDGDVFDSLRASLPAVRLENFPDRERQHFDGGLVGFLAYDAVYDCWLDEVGLDHPDTRVPDAQFLLTTKTLAFDEHDGTVSLVCTPIVGPDDDPGAVYDALADEAERVVETLSDARDPDTGGFVRRDETAGSRERYESIVEEAKERVLDGEIYQGVLSRSRELAGEVDPLALYRSLRAVNPSPYMYLLAHGDRTVVGASPETLVSVRGREVVANPIAGTCARGQSPVEDRRLAGELLADDKERAEHTMLVDLARNDVRRVAEPGSVRVAEFMNVLKYSHVQHIESTVTAHLAADADAFDATRAAFPAGTLAGAPKIRAMELIDAFEDDPRGLYGGGVGYYSWGGDADVAIVIRTATIARGGASAVDGLDEAAEDDDLVTVRAGAGIVADSDPAAEYEETEAKMDGVLTALERIESTDAGDADVGGGDAGRRDGGAGERASDADERDGDAGSGGDDADEMDADAPSNTAEVSR
ncbi:anthranilate synthase component I [Halovivax limisalsi]|uniref:anthranilate synthase component I n=1 Tax=Halovivax limisalsi TaxID=1453760 RepID=UPI001FFD9E09|nr:anthranilate synthase component I [Halovivax limisalsi]